jgi:hypothetical protein
MAGSVDPGRQPASSVCLLIHPPHFLANENLAIVHLDQSEYTGGQTEAIGEWLVLTLAVIQ